MMTYKESRSWTRDYLTYAYNPTMELRLSCGMGRTFAPKAEKASNHSWRKFFLGK